MLQAVTEGLTKSLVVLSDGQRGSMCVTWLRRCFSLILTRRMRQTKETTTKKARKMPMSKYSVGCCKTTQARFSLAVNGPSQGKAHGANFPLAQDKLVGCSSCM